MSLIIGISHSSFTPKDSSTAIEGSTVFTTDPIDPKRGSGHSAERFFMSKAKLDALDFTPAVGQNVEVLYNRYGKVGTLRLLSEADVDFG